MKILHLLASPAYTGPAETVTQLALAQRALGHEVTIAVDRKRTKTTSEEPIVPRLESLQLLDTRGLELSVKSSPWALATDVLTLRGAGVDVIHSHFSHDHTLARIAKTRATRLIRSIHAPRSLRWTTPKADGYTIPMDSLARQLIGQKVLVLPAFVAPEFVPSPRKQRQHKKIGMISSFQPSRRHDLGIAAFLKLNANAELELIGDGALEPELRKLAEPAKDAIHFAGYHSGAAFIERLQQLDEVWILGLGNDWSARAAAQARACGVRVIAVDEGDLARYADALVEPEVDALIAASNSDARREVKLESPAALAQRVLSFYEGMK
ncbi:MAG: glycosyltransferase [Archangium sp.]|nr:glycosyltransferase [Archangium sp.]